MREIAIIAVTMLGAAVLSAATISYGSLNGTRADDVLYPSYTYNAQIDGGRGVNTLNYGRSWQRIGRSPAATTSINVNLADRTALSTTQVGRDSVRNIRNVVVPYERRTATVTLVGDWWGNRLVSASPDTYIDGGPGDDVIEVVAGAHVRGGPGADRFIIHRGGNSRQPVTILDFNPGQGDTIVNPHGVTVVR